MTPADLLADLTAAAARIRSHLAWLDGSDDRLSRMLAENADDRAKSKDMLKLVEAELAVANRNAQRGM